MTSKIGVILPYNFNLSRQDNLAILKETFKRFLPRKILDRHSFDNFWSPPSLSCPYMYLFSSMYYPDFMTKSAYEEYLDREDVYTDNKIYIGEIK